MPVNGRIRGFTLIELLVSLSIGVILILLALPAYHRWIADTNISVAASTVADGLRTAQAEAVRRNTNMEFTIGGSGWSVQPPAGVAVKVAEFAEGAKLATLATLPGGTTTVTFNAFGLVEAANASAPTVPFTEVNVSAPSGTRPLRVKVGGGSTGIKICDPKFAYSDAHPDGCPP